MSELKHSHCLPKRQAGADLKCSAVDGIPFLPRSVGKWMWIHLMRIFLLAFSMELHFTLTFKKKKKDGCVLKC